MPRSYDPRRHPKGPQIQPQKTNAHRGMKRIGAIGAVVPGDDIEVARELARLRDELKRKKTVPGPKDLVAIWYYSEHFGATGAQDGVWRVPYVDGQAYVWNVGRLFGRSETQPGSAYTVRFEKSPGGGAFSATTIGTVVIPATTVREDEVIDDLGTIESGELLRIYVVTNGSTGSTFTFELEAHVN